MGYMFGASGGAFLLSKEIWIVEHGFIEFVGFWLAMTYMVKKAGPGMAKSLDAIEANYRQKHWEEPIEKIKADATAVIKAGEEGIWQEAGQKDLDEAKRENVDLQLESTYRQRLAEVHAQVKKRLDYQMEIEAAKRVRADSHGQLDHLQCRQGHHTTAGERLHHKMHRRPESARRQASRTSNCINLRHFFCRNFTNLFYHYCYSISHTEHVYF